MSKKTGLQRCEEALKRLISGQPHLAHYIGVKHGDITPAMVSTEAGFDKGYLKRSRDLHLPLIARIDALKSDSKPTPTVHKEKLEKAHNLAEKRRKEFMQLKQIMDKVLTQNLMLVERVRELETELAKCRNSVPR